MHGVGNQEYLGVFGLFTDVIYLITYCIRRSDTANALRDPLLRCNVFMPGLKREDVEKFLLDANLRHEDGGFCV
ncbi:hypothetical protein H257_16685 [Aphanomyces astaci]|uniref:Uncharacterized protein n=1 Tax=Aphanomyces astaci TaxID=112090 RepID=W4FJH8_APHAT|nr:hypothetical protein H257_16685 [Aphanomyces astaci]ETV66994.1 hypothetical protein H257_16685 [Aphanomyces astaci]|eukprot:XP_009843511.1 hypothetical protein H257_16685 [Aphanomyces astaci]